MVDIIFPRLSTPTIANYDRILCDSTITENLVKGEVAIHSMTPKAQGHPDEKGLKTHNSLLGPFLRMSLACCEGGW